MIGARSFSFSVAALACFLFGTSAHSQDPSPPRQIDPDHFAPTPRDAATIAPHRPYAAAPAVTPPAPRAPTPIVMPSRERPFGACDPTAHDWMTCLGATAQRSDRAVTDAEARLIAGLEGRPRLNPVMRETIAKAIVGADEVWRALRERECAELAMIERGVTGAYYEARLVCRIHRNLERAEALTTRYSGEP